MKSAVLAVLISLVAAPAVAETCAPAKLMRMVTRSVGPDIVPGSFRAKPLTLYRQGERFLRSEEAADPEQKQHLLVVVAEPDIWFVNRADRTGRHVVDPGPSYVAHAPIVAGQGVPAAFTELEFGCEAAFARSRGREGGARAVAGREARIHVLQEGDRRLEILLAPDNNPLEVAYYEGARTVLMIRYDVYETGLPDNPALFRRPEGFTFQEAAAR